MSRPTIIFAIACLLHFMHAVLAKTFGTCELVMELRKQGFPEDQLNQWLCLIEAESSRQTDAIGGPDSDGSFDFGLFQINDRYWCSYGRPGKGCNVRCADLTTDDTTQASRCAKQIYDQQGFSAWVGWNDECRGKILPDIYC